MHEILLALNILTFIYVGFVYLEYDFKMGIFVAAIIRFVQTQRVAHFDTNNENSLWVSKRGIEAFSSSI